MALEDQDLDNQDDDVAVRCCGFCNPNMSTAFKRVLILRTWSLVRTFLAFWVLIYISGSLFSLFGFIHAKNVNLVCVYTTMVPV